MTVMSLADKTCRQLSYVGLSQSDIHTVINDLNRWSKSSGSEWTVQRLKSLKLEYVHRLAHTDYRAPWVSRKSDGYPCGVWGKIMRLDSQKGVQKALIALMCYSHFVGKSRPTKLQWKKFISSVKDPCPVKSMDVPKAEVVPKRLSNWIEDNFIRMVLQPVDVFPVGSNRRVPMVSLDLFSGKATRFSAREGSLFEWLTPGYISASPLSYLSLKKKSAEYFVNFLSATLEGNWSYATDNVDQYPSTWKLDEEDRDVYGKPYPDPPNYLEGFLAGRISFIQEPGMKLRAVANPDRLLQLYLKPYQKALLSALDTIHEDCTTDQMKGVHRVREWLRTGYECHSIDLSDATNNFPLEYQREVLSGYGSWSDSYLDTFCWASRLNWDVKDPEEGWTNVKWKKGQPLGLGPSFMCFALSHHALARGCLGRDNYVILGDDIVTKVDPAPYLAALDKLGCPVSFEKTLSSRTVAEFAGHLIREDGVYPSPKWKGWGDRNFLEMIRNLGPSAIKNLPPRQRRVAKILTEIPEWYGGFGWNPDGRSLVERVELGEAYLAAKKEPLMGHTAQLRVSELMHARLNLSTDAFTSPEVSAVTTDQVVSQGSLKEDLLRAYQPLVTRDPEAAGLQEIYSLGVPTSDPRGPTRLEVEERRLAAMSLTNSNLLDYGHLVTKVQQAEQVPFQSHDWNRSSLGRGL